MNKQRRGDYGNAPNTVPNVGLDKKAPKSAPKKAAKIKKSPRGY